MDLSILTIQCLHQVPTKLALFRVLENGETSKYLRSVREEIIQWMFEVCLNLLLVSTTRLSQMLSRYHTFLSMLN